MTQHITVPEIEKKHTPRVWLTEGREKLGMSRQEFGDLCGCSELLLSWLEAGTTITHPLIAATLVRVIGGTVEQYNQLVHEDRRATAIPKVKVPKIAPWKPKLIKCEGCGTDYIQKNPNQRFCSISCSAIARHRKRKEAAANG